MEHNKDGASSYTNERFRRRQGNVEKFGEARPLEKKHLAGYTRKHPRERALTALAGHCSHPPAAPPRKAQHSGVRGTATPAPGAALALPGSAPGAPLPWRAREPASRARAAGAFWGERRALIGRERRGAGADWPRAEGGGR